MAAASSVRIIQSVARALVAAAALATQLPLFAADTFEIRLTPVPIETSTRAATTGAGSATAVLDRNRLSISGSFRGLVGPATVAHLHSGVALGVRGPSFAELEVPQATEGAFNAELTLTPEQIAALQAGHVYLQLHSTSAPDGNLWGWLLQ